MDWISLKGQIGRKDFVIRLLIIWLIFAALIYIGYSTIGNRVEVKTLLVFKSIAEFLMILLCLPSIIKRLRSINWSSYFAGFFVLAGLFDLRNLILLGMSISSIQAYILIAFHFIVLVILLILVFKKGKNSNVQIAYP